MKTRKMIMHMMIVHMVVVIGCMLVVLIARSSHVMPVSAQSPTVPSLSSGPSGALSGSENCNGLDIVVLVDQSASMGGEPGTAANDPENFRIDAAREIIFRLGENRLYFCPNVIHRAAILSFGDGIETNLNFTEITPDPQADFAFWKEQRQRLTEGIKPMNLGGTDFITAFLKAKEWFAGLPDIENNKRAIILLTDGGPCPKRLGCVRGAENGFKIGLYLEDLKEQIEQDFPFEEGKGYYIWVVAMHDLGSDYLNQYIGGNIKKKLGEWWQQDIAQTHGGDLIKLSKNREDIPATFFTILQQVLGTGDVGLLDCGSHFIKPYMDKAIFIFFKGRGQTGVSIEHTLADGTNIVIRNGKVTPPRIAIADYLADGHIERYVISKPDAGMWTLTADDCEGVRIYQESITAKISMVQPSAPVLLYEDQPLYNPGAPEYLVYRVEERGTGAWFPEDPRYPLTIHAQITSPVGSTYMLTLSSIGNGQYKSSSPILVNEVGKYTISLVGIAENAGQIFSIRGGNYEVYVEIKPFNLVVAAPRKDEIIPLNEPGTRKTLPVQTRLHLLDNNGQKLDPKRVFTDTEKAIEVTLLNAKNEPVERTFMSLDPQHPDSFIATLDKASKEGAYSLGFEIKGGYRVDRFRPISSRVDVPIRRRLVKYFDFTITSAISNTTFPIHGPLWEAALGRVKTNEIEIRLVDESGLTLDPNKVLHSPDQAFEITLAAPDGSKEKVPATLALDQWTSTLPTRRVRAGTYVLEAELITKAQEGWVSLASTHQMRFERRDTLWTNPLVWRPVSGFLAFLLLLVAWAIRLRLRPAGILAFVDRKTDLVLHEEHLSHPLRGWLHRYVSKSRALKDLGIGKLIAAKGKPDEERRRTVNLVLYDLEGKVLAQEDGLPSGEDFWLDAEVKIKYD